MYKYLLIVLPVFVSASEEKRIKYTPKQLYEIRDKKAAAKSKPRLLTVPTNSPEIKPAAMPLKEVPFSDVVLTEDILIIIPKEDKDK